MRKKAAILTLTLALALTGSPLTALRTHADTLDTIKSKKAATESQYKEAVSQISDLTEKQNAILAQIDDTDKELVNTMISIEALDNSLTQKEADIADTQAKLQQAEATQQKQYDAMKKRIQYLYENGSDTTWLVTLLENGDISEMLSAVKQTQDLYDYDQKALAKYIEAVQAVSDLNAQLEADKKELESTKQEQVGQQAALNTQIANLKSSNSDYAGKLASAQSTADQFNVLLQQQTEQMKTIEAQQQAQAEAKRQAEAAAQAEATRQADVAKQAEASKESEAAEQAEAAKQSDAAAQEAASSDNDGADAAAPETQPDTSPEDTADEATHSVSVGASGIGQAVADLASSYIGVLDYAEGGTDLTPGGSGVDCSGFVHAIYAQFGVDVTSYSGAIRTEGTGVSVAEAQPGDVICYDGHVGIYVGGDTMVAAADYGLGVKTSNIYYKQILSVRRFSN